ncbi:MAG TPA: hypothetical protein VEP89_13370 [Draconibacterium sp.]|nr:hypothetical protein [Draconibacterium sp.]
MKTTNLLIVVIVLLAATACIFSDEDDKEPQSYLFIENLNETNGVLISGPEPASLQIDFPTYRYDENLKTLNAIIDFEIYNDLKFIYGSGDCLSGTVGGGCATGLTGVYGVPFERGSFEVLKIEDDGTIRYIYEDEVFSLGINEQHVVVTTYMDTADVDGLSSISEVTETQTISNYGYINEADIISWDW